MYITMDNNKEKKIKPLNWQIYIFETVYSMVRSFSVYSCTAHTTYNYSTNQNK